MPVFKITYFFENIQTGTPNAAGAAHGWTETWYINQPFTLEQALAYASSTTWLQLRRAFLSEVNFIRWVRVSLVGGKQEKVARIQNGGGLITTTPTQVTCCVLVTFTAPPVVGVPPPADISHRKNVLLRGLSMAMVHGDVLATLSPDYMALVAWCNFMVGVAGVDMALTPPAPNIMGIAYDDPAQTWQTIHAAAPIGDLTRFTMDAGITTVQGDRVRIRRVKYPSQLNQTWTSLTFGVSPQTYGTSRRQLPLGPWQADDGGQARKIVTLVATIRNFLIVSSRTKKTGRPFRLPVGRSRRV